MDFWLEGYRPTEYDGQCAVVAWLELLQQQRFPISFHASPSEYVGRNVLGAAKKSGMRTGWFDLEIFLNYPRAIFIEYKLEDGVLGPAQCDIHRELRKLGWPVHVIRYSTTNQAVEKTAEVLREYGLEVRPA